MSPVNEPLLALFRGHGVGAVLQGEWITFSDSGLRASADVVAETQHPSALTIQLDVRLEIEPGEWIVESFLGIGVTRDQALVDAFTNFTSSSFHVLLAFFFRGAGDHVSREE